MKSLHPLATAGIHWCELSRASKQSRLNYDIPYASSTSLCCEGVSVSEKYVISYQQRKQNAAEFINNARWSRR